MIPAALILATPDAATPLPAAAGCPSRPVTAPQPVYSCLNATSRLTITAPSLPLTVRWEDYVPRYIESVRERSFVQIGGNCGTNTRACGQAGDPIWEYATRCGWTGVVLEPAVATFEKLCANYAPHARVRPLNAAASNRSGRARLMTRLDRLSEASRLAWNPMGRFWKQRLAGGPSETVRMLSLHDLWAQLPWLGERAEVDLLVVDAEGEEKIILGGALPSPAPRLIFYEHKHIKDRHVRAIEENLARQGFERIAEIPHIAARNGAKHRGDMLYGRPRAAV